MILLAIASFCKECVSSFVYYSRQNNTSCVVGIGGLMNIACSVILPILLIVSIVALKAVWWLPACIISAGWGCAKLIGMIPFVSAIVWIVAYIGLPVSVIWTIIEMINQYNLQ